MATETDIEPDEVEPTRSEKAAGFVNDTVDGVLSHALETRSRMAVYVGLRKLGDADEEEIAEETGLYPEKVDGTLEELIDDEIVLPVGGNYRAVSPTELVRKLPNRIGDFIDTVLEREEDEEEPGTRIEVE